ncbi:hypothetical protein [Saccharothrix syringae]|uniref:Secreted protein n=1 Tax=Saccharothrix syringae TaxID=103733 RepID=A0A5Q0GYZ3_SACSY|nr:hypothetical protein [Saccharothrix syringae]QFZ18592.1 hypothetical protein EKG83_14985 [Saccharothrix syringae]
MGIKSFLRKLSVPLAVAAAVVAGGAGTAGATTATPVQYALTLCNPANEIHSSLSFPNRNIRSFIAWTNQCVTSTHYGNEPVYVIVNHDRSGYATRSYALPRFNRNMTITVSGTYNNPAITFPAL